MLYLIPMAVKSKVLFFNPAVIGVCQYNLITSARKIIFSFICCNVENFTVLIIVLCIEDG